MIQIIPSSDRDKLRRLLHVLRTGQLLAAHEKDQVNIPQAVHEILHDILERGDEALCYWEAKLDQARLTPAQLRVAPALIAEAQAEAEPQFMAVIRRAAENIRAYQEQIMHRNPPELVRGGRRMGLRYLPVDRAAVYVPGGQALYPSTVLMTVIPALVAGVKEVVMVSPPRGGVIDPMVLALAGELGVTEVYRLGGAVAIGALAYGTPSVSAVDKIVGPGNAFVAEAKRQVLGKVGIDSIAGPSEVLIIADESAQPEYIAADLLAQAEHNPGSALLMTPSASLAEAVRQQIEMQLPELTRSEVTRSALENYSAIVVTESLDEACDLANVFATEHLQIMTENPDETLGKIRHAGAIFIGPQTPVPLGDYFAGPSHVLPTGGTARFFSPLSCNDFLKASSTIRYDAESLKADAKDVMSFAGREGLTAHAEAVNKRLDS